MKIHSKPISSLIERVSSILLPILFTLMAAVLPARADWPNTNETKWVQYPDLQGLDVQMATPLILADDFMCQETAPITDIHLWASWAYDQFQPVQTFILSIWNDVPAGLGNPFSHPGTNMLWQEIFQLQLGQYQWREWTNEANELYWMPEPPPLGTILGPEHVIWQYNFYPTNPFVQEGTPEQPVVYWLSVTVPQPVQIGWKTTTNHWNDDAVAGHTDMDGAPMGDWWELRDPRNTNISLDLSFALTTKTPTEDFGDAPDPIYPTLLLSNGARHTVFPAIRLGALIDAEVNGLPNATATGDDISNLQDEDGVFFTSPIIPGQMATVTVVSSMNQLVLNAWLDFGVDGSWLTPGDQIFFNQMLLAGTNVLTFFVPPNAVMGNTFARFRVSTMGNLQPTGLAPNGEVEDYQVHITQGIDFGDAQDTAALPLYRTLLFNDGARHVIIPGVRLGAMIDAETDGQPNANATGDDLNNLRDEDGVVLWGSQMIPGDIAAVTVGNTAPGYLSAWVDFNADGSWATPGDQIITNYFISIATSTNLYFNVPFGAARNTNTFARFRFSTQPITNYFGWSADGEVEDYYWYIAELDFGDAPDPSYPTYYANNGAYHWILTLPQGVVVNLGAQIDAEWDGQPNANATGDDIAGLADEDGVFINGPLIPGAPATILVIPSIANGFLNAWIDFNGNGSWADPGEQVFNGLQLTSAGPTNLLFIVPPFTPWNSTVFARFRFSTSQFLSYTNTPGWTPNGEVEDYLWPTAALDFGDAPDPSYPTLLANNGARHAIGALFMGPSVDTELDGQPGPNALGDDINGAPDENGVVFNTAMVAGVPATVTVTSSGMGVVQAWIDYNQNGSWADPGERVINAGVVPGPNVLNFVVPNNVVPGKTFARFRLSSQGGLSFTGLALDGEVEDYTVTLYTLKWLQPPELGWQGVDVDNYWVPLADDFLCTESGPITDIHLWGSFVGDVLPVGGVNQMTVTLSFYSDIPVGGTNAYSRPGTLLWQKTFNPGAYSGGLCLKTGNGEWWHDPATQAWFFPGDTNIYQLDFYIPPSQCFTQVQNTIYWLGVKYQQQAGDNFTFGWKTTVANWNDAACWLDTSLAIPVWKPLAFGGTHPWAPNPMDLSFALSGMPAALDLDYGDAPDPPYPTVLANNGARHFSVPGFRLGMLEDTESDGQPHVLAVGDDNNSLADEDGVAFITNPLIISTQAWVKVSLMAPAAGLLDAWVDFNANGAWETSAGEQIFTNQLLVTGANTLSFGVPVNATLGTNFARFRLSSTGGLGPVGLAQDGEVEDYLVRIAQPRPSTNIVITNITVAAVGTNQAVTVKWNAQSGIQYQLTYCGALTNSPLVWSNVGGIVIGPAYSQTETNALIFQRYYRVFAPDVWP